MLMQFEQKLRRSHTNGNVANIKNDLFFPPGKNGEDMIGEGHH